MTATTHLIYFSPTGTTRKVVQEVARGLSGGETGQHDLTRQGEGANLHLTEGIAIIGTPVYAGRVPEIVLQRLAGLSGDGVPAVLVALYGNRAYEDCLVELRDVVAARGFRVVAASAFVGQHSYATPDCPIAVDRPDAEDLRKARDFGVAVAGKLALGTDEECLAIPGASPYRERVQFGGIAPETDPELCSLCGTCARVCPVFIIDVDQEVRTNEAACLMCCACVKYCRDKARALRHPVIVSRRELLVKNCSQRKEPSCFL